MTARIAGFVSRADAGLRGPRSVSRNITPSRGGVGVHYGGPAQPAAAAGSDHAKCIATWRGWQTYHMNTKGWSDIAYTGGFCQHGFAFAGRGVGVRTAANGTNDGNQRYYAITWIGGEGQTPTQEALDAADWWLHTLRAQGAGGEVRPHRFFKSTGCPGDPLVGYAASRHGNPNLGDVKPVPHNPTPPSTKWVAEGSGLLKRYVYGPRTKKVQAHLGIADDGYYGDDTYGAVLAYQKKHGLGADGIVGNETWNHMFPPPKPPAPSAPGYPLGRCRAHNVLSVFGPWDGPDHHVSGFQVRRGRIVGRAGHPGLRAWQQQMKNRGWDIDVDGLFGEQCAEIARKFQVEKGLGVDSLVGPETWAAAWTAPVT